MTVIELAAHRSINRFSFGSLVTAIFSSRDTILERNPWRRNHGTRNGTLFPASSSGPYIARHVHMKVFQAYQHDLI